MKRQELLHDPASLERGEQLVDLYLSAFKRFRTSMLAPEEAVYYHNNFSTAAEYLTNQATKDEMVDDDYLKLGKTIVAAKKAYDRESELMLEAYAPVRQFLADSLNAPIAVDVRNKRVFPKPISIGVYGNTGRRSNVVGFVAVSIPHVAALGINRHPSDRNSYYTAQVFDLGIKTATIAIGENTEY